MNKKLKKHLISASITFVSAFLGILAITIQDPTFSFSKDALGVAITSAFFAGVRALAKVVVEWNLIK